MGTSKLTKSKNMLKKIETLFRGRTQGALLFTTHLNFNYKIEFIFAVC